MAVCKTLLGPDRLAASVGLITRPQCVHNRRHYAYNIYTYVVSSTVINVVYF